MTKPLFLLLLGTFVFGGSFTATAQFVNGSFTSGYAGYTLVGPDPATFIPDSSHPPAGFSFDAAISSTTTADSDQGEPNPSNSATPGQIEAALGITSLPGSDNSMFVIDGQAFAQTFTLSVPAILTFQYSSSTFDNTGYDRVGYAIGGTFHSLPINNSNSAYSTIGPIVLGPGTYTLGFTAYNTFDNFSRTFLNIGDIQVTDVPEPATWLMLIIGSGLLAASLRIFAPAFAKRN